MPRERACRLAAVRVLVSTVIVNSFFTVLLCPGVYIYLAIQSIQLLRSLPFTLRVS